MIKDNKSQLIARRIEELSHWLELNSPYVPVDQKHLDEGSPEQAYWHLGYRAALVDAMRLLTRDRAGNDDTSSCSPGGGPDA